MKNLPEGNPAAVESSNDSHEWHTNPSLSLGGAGAALAVLLVALQINAGISNDDRICSVGLSASAFVLWLCSFCINFTSHSTANKNLQFAAIPLWKNTSLSVLCLAISLLGTAIFFLVWDANKAAAVIAFSLSVICTFLVLAYQRALKLHVPPAGSAKESSPPADSE